MSQIIRRKQHKSDESNFHVGDIVQLSKKIKKLEDTYYIVKTVKYGEKVVRINGISNRDDLLGKKLEIVEMRNDKRPIVELSSKLKSYIVKVKICGSNEKYNVPAMYLKKIQVATRDEYATDGVDKIRRIHLALYEKDLVPQTKCPWSAFGYLIGGRACRNDCTLKLFHNNEYVICTGAD